MWLERFEPETSRKLGAKSSAQGSFTKIILSSLWIRSSLCNRKQREKERDKIERERDEKRCNGDRRKLKFRADLVKLAGVAVPQESRKRTPGFRIGKMTTSRSEIAQYDGSGDFVIWRKRVLAHITVQGLKDLLKPKPILTLSLAEETPEAKEVRIQEEAA
ncbi:unnamed protein product [Microthlaspi erraticum]|uniref:Uncharacterized protein n=1 Tax=Microthlaspi erraticum TaxID=1685480 RepID=A0A6D2IBR0_9BRAS|nr:unnamed protein product [Microthlaspi erraticum]